MAFKTHGNNENPSGAYLRAVAEIKEQGKRVSCGSWEDTDSGTFCVFSIETCGPATYNSPEVCITGKMGD